MALLLCVSAGTIPVMAMKFIFVSGSDDFGNGVMVSIVFVMRTFLVTVTSFGRWWGWTWRGEEAEVARERVEGG